MSFIFVLQFAIFLLTLLNITKLGKCSDIFSRKLPLLSSLLKIFTKIWPMWVDSYLFINW